MYIIFFALAAVFLCIGVYKIATSYAKESRDTSGQIQNLQSNKFSTDMNRFAAQKEMTPSANRSALAGQLTAEIDTVETLKAAPERFEEQRNREKALFNNTISVTKAATKNKVTPAAWDVMQQKTHETDEQLRLKEAESRIGIADYNERARIDVQKDFDIRINQLKAVLALKTFPYMKLAEVRAQIKGLLLEDAEVSESKLPASVKAEYRMLLQDTIVVYRGAYERGLGLLQSVDGQDVGGTDSFTQLGSGVEDTEQTDDEQV